jgi:hypothetical protein
MVLLFLVALGLPAQTPEERQKVAEAAPLAALFRAEVDAIESRPLDGIASAGEWKARRPELQRRMREMLGLEPMPDRTPLNVRVTGTVDRPDFSVEKVVFESMPGLLVTANLYLPKSKGPHPAVLYVCGHSPMEKDGVVYGNKTAYQHHGAWLAANGIACLVVDTLQMGEVPGIHHGLYKYERWWWQSRGYTPAGVEAWNGVRALDYLCSRPEVDPKRLGVTGRSGGGATTWWLGAIDDRLSVTIPVAGITDLRDHVLMGGPDNRFPRGVVEGHCDCMYVHNIHRWDYGTVAALHAPKAMLLQNTDLDTIFPEAGVRRVFAQLETVYGWYNARDRLALQIGKGGHDDTPELRHAAFAFFRTHLLGIPTKPGEIEETDRSIPIEELKVLPAGGAPESSLNAELDRHFVAVPPLPPVPADAAGWSALRRQTSDALFDRVLSGWPAGGILVDLDPAIGFDATRDGVRLVGLDFTSQAGLRLRAWILSDANARGTGVTARVVDAKAYEAEVAPRLRYWTEPESDAKRDAAFLEPLAVGTRLVLIAPRGVGPTAWPAEADTQIRRRFWLLGQSLDGMRVWDVRQALAAIPAFEPAAGLPITLVGEGDSAVIAALAAPFDERVTRVRLRGLPATLEEVPAMFSLGRGMDWPQPLVRLAPREVEIIDPRAPEAAGWAWLREVGARWWPGLKGP